MRVTKKRVGLFFIGHFIIWVLVTSAFCIANLIKPLPFWGIFLYLLWFWGNLYIHIRLNVIIVERSFKKWEGKDGLLDPYIERLRRKLIDYRDKMEIKNV